MANPHNTSIYFHVADIAAATETSQRGGDPVHMRPVDVPCGDRIIIASDPAGAPFGAVAPGGAA